MKKLVLFVILMFALSLLVQGEAAQRFEQLAMAEDASGNRVLFNYIPARGSFSRYLYNNHPRMLLVDDKGARIYNTGTLELIADFKAKKDVVFELFNDSGYVVGTDNFFSSKEKPTYYGFDGKKLWQGKYESSVLVRPLNVVICSKSFGKEYVAYDITTGKELWTKNIFGKYHNFACGLICDDDSPQVVYMIADSLLRLDCLTGEAVLRPFRTYGEESFFSQAMFAPYRTPVNREFRKELNASFGSRNVLTGMHSNCILRGDSLIIADADSIYCFDVRYL